MPNKKELNQKQLEKVAGGKSYCHRYKVSYRKTADGEILSYDLPEQYDYASYIAELFGELEGKEWCESNNYIYVGISEIN